jgi:hypothetical protein
MASMITPIYIKSYSYTVVGYIDEFGLIEIYLVSGNFSDELYLKEGNEYILLNIS